MRFGIGVGEHVGLVEDEEDDVVGIVLVVDDEITLELVVDDFFASGDTVGDAAATIKSFVLVDTIHSRILA